MFLSPPRTVKDFVGLTHPDFLTLVAFEDRSIS